MARPRSDLPTRFPNYRPLVNSRRSFSSVDRWRTTVSISKILGTMNRGWPIHEAFDRRSQEIGDDRGTRSVKNHKNRARKKLYLSFLDITRTLLKIFARHFFDENSERENCTYKNIFKLLIQNVQKFWQYQSIVSHKICLAYHKFFLIPKYLEFDKFVASRNFLLRIIGTIFPKRNRTMCFRIVKKKKKNSDPSEVKFSPRSVSRFRAFLLCQGSTRRLSSRGQPVSSRSENNGRERPRERYSNSCHGRTRLIFTWTRWKARADPESFPLAVPAAHG